MDRRYPAAPAFTLAELLIALALLGVIATFTIPKVLNSTGDESRNAILKETVQMVSGAYEAYRLEEESTAATTIADLTPYMNYVGLDTTSNLDTIGSTSGCGGVVGTENCGAVGNACLRLHNGGMLGYEPDVSFNGTDTTNALFFEVDPDGGANSEYSAMIYLYYNGRITTRGHVAPNTVNSKETVNPGAAADPDWLDWK